MYWQLVLILCSNTISIFGITFLIFVPWKKGPSWWTNVSFTVFKTLLAVVFFIIPLINIIASTFLISYPKINLEDQPIFSYVVFYTVLCCHRIFDFFTAVRKQLIDEASYFQSLQQLSKEELEDYLRTIKKA